jgi:DNA-directed RNA polymerase specialized sigma24 family protein
MCDPLVDNARLADLVVRYQTTLNGEREKLFSDIVQAVLPLIESMIFRYRWDFTLAESSGDLTNTVILKLPKMLSAWKADNGKSFTSYFLSGMLNTFRHGYAKRQRRSRYQGDWPVDEDGNETEIADTNTQKLNGDATTLVERGREFEKLMFRIPDELARLVDAEYSGLVRYIAERYLMRADNHETLYFTELRREVSLLPTAKCLTEKEIDALVRMVIAGVRARLYPLRSPDEVPPTRLGFLSPSGAVPPRKGSLYLLPCRSWPLLLILDPAQTELLLHCLAGVHEAVPAKDKWMRESEAGGSKRNEANGDARCYAKR